MGSWIRPRSARVARRRVWPRHTATSRHVRKATAWCKRQRSAAWVDVTLARWRAMREAAARQCARVTAPRRVRSTLAALAALSRNRHRRPPSSATASRHDASTAASCRRRLRDAQRTATALVASRVRRQATQARIATSCCRCSHSMPTRRSAAPAALAATPASRASIHLASARAAAT